MDIDAALRHLYPDAPHGSWQLMQGPETDWKVAITYFDSDLLGPLPTQEALEAAYAEWVALAAETDMPPVVISSDAITVADAEFLWAAAQGSDQQPPNAVAAWLIAKLEL